MPFDVVCVVRLELGGDTVEGTLDRVLRGGVDHLGLIFLVR